MANIDYIEEITKIARENIKKGDDAGLGMYNFDLWLNKPIQRKVYPKNVILQTYPYKDNQWYGLTFLLCYYPVGKDDWDDDCYNFNDLTDEEKEYVFNEFKKQIEETNNNNNTNMDMTKLSNFVKKDITFEEKVQLIVDWEEDRGSDGEYVYDLDDDGDAWYWKELYDLKTLYKCRAEGRYWMGGWEFGCNGLNTKGNCSTAFCITEEKMKNLFTDNSILGEIADRFEDWMMANDGYDEEKAINDFSNIYGNLIDFKAYKKAQEPTQWKWYGVSHDGAYQEESKLTFKSKKDCYIGMRNEALEKAKWNTEYDEDFEDDECIRYTFHFTPNYIEHLSYSGLYHYEIVPSNTELTPSFFTEKIKELNNKYLNDDYRSQF